MGAGRAGSLDHLLPRRDVAYAPVPEKETVKRLVLTDAMLTEVHGKIANWDIYHAAVREVKKLCEVTPQPLATSSFFLVARPFPLGFRPPKS